jgi:hypothetical protein
MVPLMSRIPSYHLPREWRGRTRFLQTNGIDLEIASPSAGEWDGIAAALRLARARLRRRGIDDVLRALQRAHDDWTKTGSEQRRRAEELLPAVTGFSAAMVRHALPRLLDPLGSDAIRDLLAAELCSSKGRSPVVPGLLLHILSGNIPGLAAIPMHLSLALQSAAILKTASGDPLFAALWAQAIAAADPELGDCLAVTYWPGGDAATEGALFEAADVVVASGGDAAIEGIAARVRSRFVGYGHKISFAVMGKECLDGDAPELARRLAYDVSLWDQHGCLSPQVCYIEAGGRVTPREFGEMLAQWLDHYAAELPPRLLTLDEKAAVLRFREEAEWSADASMLSSRDSSAWTVAIERTARFRPTCLNRCVRLLHVGELDEIAPALRGHRRHLEAAGVAVGARRHRQLSQALGEAGVHRVCAIGRMQQPALSWCPGGRPRVGDWVEWMQIEGCDD